MCGFCVGFLFSSVVLGDLSSLAIILPRKREVLALLKMCCGCLHSVSLPCCAMGSSWPAIWDCGISCHTHFFQSLSDLILLTITGVVLG